jgi:hypothetical protein
VNFLDLRREAFETLATVGLGHHHCMNAASLTRWRHHGRRQDKTAPQDASRINVNEDYELRYWTKKFGVSDQQLKDAVAAVGVSVDKVKEYLKR